MKENSEIELHSLLGFAKSSVACVLYKLQRAFKSREIIGGWKTKKEASAIAQSVSPGQLSRNLQKLAFDNCVTLRV